MKKNELNKITEITNKATKAPWKSYIEGRDHESGSNFIMTSYQSDRDYDIEFIEIKAEDQDFIAIARNVVPELVEEITRLQELLDRHSISY